MFYAGASGGAPAFAALAAPADTAQCVEERIDAARAAAEKGAALEKPRAWHEFQVHGVAPEPVWSLGGLCRVCATRLGVALYLLPPREAAGSLKARPPRARPKAR
jgi:hypothetical protein